MDGSSGGAENGLAGESSPYLLQHARNPVRWHAWNAAALERAREENKPIFLSVGYSSCHWCHVMARESFEDEGVAAVMNEHFVNVKVDREERPDIDHIYQAACQAATGQGGWPLSVFLTPDLKPFYAGTYFPPSDSYGRPGFGSLLRRMAQAWRENPAEVARAAGRFALSLRDGPEGRPGPERLGRAALDEAAVGLLNSGDRAHGGFGSAPKFPNAACVSFLLRYGRLSGIPAFTAFALKTLDGMARGGIFDHVGGGFHRYSTDARWLVPHFEKMLYDNALIPANYAEAYQATGSARYLDVMERTLDYVLRELATPEGGFCSSQDADAGGEEGAFYAWTKPEVVRLLGAADAEPFCLYYGVTDGGNWEGSTVLSNSAGLQAVAFRCGLTEEKVEAALRRGRDALLEHRNSAREAPGLDGKAIASWNALAITALARGHRASRRAAYLEAARRCERFVESRLSGPSGSVMRAYKDGRAGIGGYLEDHAFYAAALLDLFEVDPEARYLERARGLCRIILDRFWDPGGGRFYMTAEGAEDLIVRPRSEHDLSLPSGSSAAVHAFSRLHGIAGEPEMEAAAAKALESQARRAAENPFAFGHLLCAACAREGGPVDVTVMGAGGRMAVALSGAYAPEAAVVTVRDAAQLAALSGYEMFRGKEFGAGDSAFVCRDFSCSPRLDDPRQVLERLEPARSGAT